MEVNEVQVTGGQPKSYLVVKDGKKSIKVKKGSYKKQFPALFGDCVRMMETYSGRKPNYDEMAFHVLYFNIACD